MGNNDFKGDEKLENFSDDQIEKINLKRIASVCVCILFFQIINLFNPQFYVQRILWGGTFLLSLSAVIFLILILVIKRNSSFKNISFIYKLFWSILVIGVFPFLYRDASMSLIPLNCVVLAGVLICAPILKKNDLRFIYLVSIIVNVCACLYAKDIPFYYYLQVVIINITAYLLANNLHGKYMELFDKQRQAYKAYMNSILEQESLKAKLNEEKSANSAKSEFLSRMSHDLRTPLNGIIGSSYLALNDDIPREEVNDYLNKINQSGKYLLSLINDVLDMSKIESDKMELHPEPYTLSEFLDTVNSIIKEQCSEKDIDFDIVCKEVDIKCVMLDRLRFNQIFLNLLSNSVKFTPKGGKIDLIIEHLSKDDDKIKKRFIVRDTGIGMSKEFLAHAFEPFTQEKAGDTSEGTGLGLSIVYKIVELMNGRIYIESEPGKGTSVTVELEVDIVKDMEDKEEKTEFDLNKLKGKRILIFEDNELNLMIAKTLLEQKGIYAECAENGKIGVDMYLNKEPYHYDAVLMDIQMPVMNGLEACKKIRESNKEDCKSIPVIAMTANAFAEDIKCSIDAGMDEHLAKPIEPDILYKTIYKQIFK
ncbi:ATP-binding protein [Anaerofustis stercorihominis]|uniref:hybrid sensor histidine kinase/response regulator n=1 Tax=Anaerofustis stercorihominis TaxID=214853 RepID=UPI00210AEF05|nr:ATP-binding protein [Anaerofustis stercorihominis]MCQ4794556.1 ATP-binding protein [Anaerofustis stercorihominis]